ncbi:hypothetical protein GCM10009788_53550 [Nocardioides humi]|uniref:Helix-turn-helix domain-containing protein n=2 Tax=Nocardioides humi TaxID=449461 RepID=A0ABN2BNU0_9ACTN|nr:helix-turn-helix domain-containing protein [Nocardioides humi]
MPTARPRYLSQQALADELGVSVRTIRRRIASGAIPGYLVGSRIRVKESDAATLIRPIAAGVA